MRKAAVSMVTSPSTTEIGISEMKSSLAAVRKPSSVKNMQRAVRSAAPKTDRTPQRKPAVSCMAFPFVRKGLAAMPKRTAGRAMFTVLQPSTVRPPNWKRIACRSRPMKMAGNAAHPRMSPMRPFKSRCTLDGPTGTWISEAMKNVAEKMATVASLSVGRRLRPTASPAAQAAPPAMRMGAERTPSAICME